MSTFNVPMKMDRLPPQDYVHYFWQDLSWYSHYIAVMKRGLVKAGAEARTDFDRAMKKSGYVR